MSFSAREKKITQKFPLVGDVASAHLSEFGTAMVATLELGGNLLQDSMAALHAVN